MNTTLTQWLYKLTYLPFGRTRWSPRLFVLLDSELYIYKDELKENLSKKLDLNKLQNVVHLKQTSHCLQLELIGQEKPIKIQYKSEKELNQWMQAIKKIMTADICIKESSIDPSVFRLPTQPLRCTNITEPTLCERRGRKLNPIQTSIPSLLSSISTTSTVSSNPSPTGAVIGYIDSKGYIAPQLIKHRILPHEENENDLSPTYLIYKTKFHL